jgi:hypothetical protein
MKVEREKNKTIHAYDGGRKREKQNRLLKQYMYMMEVEIEKNKIDYRDNTCI